MFSTDAFSDFFVFSLSRRKMSTKQYEVDLKCPLKNFIQNKWFLLYLGEKAIKCDGVRWILRANSKISGGQTKSSCVFSGGLILYVYAFKTTPPFLNEFIMHYKSLQRHQRRNFNNKCQDKFFIEILVLNINFPPLTKSRLNIYLHF